jgi:hypothetical protein
MKSGALKPENKPEIVRVVFTKIWVMQSGVLRPEVVSVVPEEICGMKWSVACPGNFQAFLYVMRSQEVGFSK